MSTAKIMAEMHAEEIGQTVGAVPKIGTGPTVTFDGNCFADINARTGNDTHPVRISVYADDIPAMVTNLMNAYAAAKVHEATRTTDQENN